MDSIQAIVLALIQGATEFLPISSSAHLILPAALTDWPDQGLPFDVAVHLGSLAAISLYFRHDLANFARSVQRFVKTGVRDEDFDTLGHVALASVPIVVCGLLFKSTVETTWRSVDVIAVATILFGLLLWWADSRIGRGTVPDDIRKMSYRDAFLIGLAQTLALIPGTSRSGITITAALMMRFARRDAARFSFLLSIPTISGAALLTGLDAARADEAHDWGLLALGFTVAAITAYSVVSAFIALIDRTGMTPYVVYRLVLGGILLIAF